jgi:hypothetical protein
MKARNNWIERAWEDGLTVGEIAARVGLIEGRVKHILTLYWAAYYQEFDPAWGAPEREGYWQRHDTGA